MRARREAVSVTGQILRLVGFSLVAAIVLAVALELLESYVLGSPTVLGVVLPDDLADRVSARIDVGPPGDERALLSTVAEVAGIFLGLYFAAVSTIAAAVYSDVPGDVRVLLTREKVGNVYIKLVAFVGALSLVLLTASALGVRIGFASVVAVGGLAVVSVFAFVALGMRTFNFFSPDTLAFYLVKDLAPLISSAQRGRFATTHEAIPFNYQQQAESLLSTFRSVADLSASRQSVTGRSLVGIVSAVLRLLAAYGDAKSDIPYDSFWFKRRLEHPHWLTANYTAVNIAVQTRTGIQGKPVPDRLWFERELHEVLRITLAGLLERQERGPAVEACTELISWTRVYARQLMIEETLRLSSLTQGLIAEHLDKRPAGDRTQESISLAEIAAGMPMQIVLGLSDRVRTLDASSFVKATTRTDGSERFDGSWPDEVAFQRDYLYERIENERAVEGKLITAHWYLAQLMALAMSRFFGRVVPLLALELGKTPVSAQGLIGSSQPILGAATVQLGIEACEKYRVHLREFEQCLTRLEELRKLSDVPWKETDWEAAYRQVTEHRTQLLRLTADIADAVSEVETGGEIPDYFGATYALLGEECFASILADHASGLGTLFPPFFRLSLVARDRLGEQLADYDTHTQALWSTATIETLLDMSGYAVLSRELGRGACWDVVKGQWDGFLEGLDRRRFFDFLFAVLSFRDGSLGINPGDLGRSTWGMTYMAHLRELGVVEDELGFHGRATAGAIASPLTRASLGALGPHAAQAFVATYLLNWPEAAGIDLPRETQRFIEQLEFHTRRSDDGASPETPEADPTRRDFDVDV